jgi:hypothetical protein
MGAVSWGMFLVAYVYAWDAGINKALVRYRKDRGETSSPSSMRRGYFACMAAYAMAFSWLFIIGGFAMLYTFVSVFVVSIPFVHRTIYSWFSGVRPENVTVCMEMRFIPIHIFLSFVSLALAGMAAGFYVTDSDFDSDSKDDEMGVDPAMAKLLRILYVPTTVILAAYVGIALQDVFFN